MRILLVKASFCHIPMEIVWLFVTIGLKISKKTQDKAITNLFCKIHYMEERY
jgi:hypothetical protein